MITMLLIKTHERGNNNDITITEVQLSPYLNGHDRLTEIYRLLEVDTIDITTRFIGTRLYDIICDDNGLLKDKQHITLFRNQEPELVGNLLITKSNELGENIGLTDEELDNIKYNIHLAEYTTSDGKKYETINLV